MVTNMFGIQILIVFVLDRAIGKANCFHDKGHDAKCSLSNYPSMAAFGIVQIMLSQIPNFHKLSFLSIIATVMSFCYASIGIGLSIATVTSTFFPPYLILSFKIYEELSQTIFRSPICIIYRVYILT